MARRPRQSESIVVSTVDAREVLSQLNKLPKEVQQELRQRNRRDAEELKVLLFRAAYMPGVPPQAELVAKSLQAKSDRLIKVSVGGTKKVGRKYRQRPANDSTETRRPLVRAAAGTLLGGSEFGSRGGVDRAGRKMGNRFVFGRKERGYWIRPTVDEFGQEFADKWRVRCQRIISGLGFDR